MLTKLSIESALPLAVMLADKGVLLEPTNGSPLSELVNASVFHMNVQHSFSGEGLEETAPIADLDGFAGALRESSSTPDGAGTDNYQHDALMEDFVGKATEAVLFNLKLARNQVRDQMSQMVKACEEAVNANSASTLNPLNIVARKYDDLTNNGLLTELSSRYGEVVYSDLPLSLKIPMPEDMSQYLHTDMAAYDGALSAYVESIGPAGVARLWNIMFGSQGSTISDIVRLDRPDTWAQGMLAAVIAMNVERNVPQGVTISLEDLRLYLARLRSNIGRVLHAIPGRRESEGRSDRLLVQAPSGESPRGDVIVNPDVYKRYLDQGGTPEAIFGALRNGMLPPMTELLAQRQGYETSWGRNAGQLRAVEVQRRFTAIVNSFRDSVSRFIVELPEDALPTSRATLHELLGEQLKRLTPGALEDLWSAARTVLCNVLYRHTHVEHILRIIDRTAADRDESEIGNALLQAVVEYLVDWLSYQVHQTKPAG